jgi:hypothetical protein
MGLQVVGAAAFMLAPVTSGLSLAALLAVGVTAAGVKAYQSGEQYEGLLQASKTAARPGTELVSDAQVDEAKEIANADKKALQLAALNAAALGGAAALRWAASSRSGGPSVPATPETEMEGCFVAGTVVLTPDGERPIESLLPGDEVTAHDMASGATASQRVARSFVHVVPSLLDITAGATRITCSPPHPFWVAGAGWRRAGDLRPGDPLATRDGRTIGISSIRARRGSFTVHNIEVEGLHTYHVAEIGVVVHNKAARAMRYKLQPNDLDWRGNGRTSREAVEEAFRLTGAPKDQFEVTKWGPTEHGKSMPTEWRVTKGPFRGAEVSVDIAHVKNGPDAPHVGWQGPGKKAPSGHIILDDVHVNRPTR